MNNLDAFYEWSALVLSWLYEKFPVPTSLHHGDLKSSPNPGLAERTMRFTILFLEDEGYLRYAEFKPPGQFSQVRLSRRGLNRLNLIPDREKGEDTLGEILVKRVHGGGQDSFREQIEFFLAGS
ncbi:MAG: hypothetical protein C0623_06520 [Desulfuromonas sp.]|nr:MAG: hypothetical protein C0623_06520 [Desulfuromonas sp.]